MEQKGSNELWVVKNIESGEELTPQSTQELLVLSEQENFQPSSHQIKKYSEDPLDPSPWEDFSAWKIFHESNRFQDDAPTALFEALQFEKNRKDKKPSQDSTVFQMSDEEVEKKNELFQKAGIALGVLIFLFGAWKIYAQLENFAKKASRDDSVSENIERTSEGIPPPPKPFVPSSLPKTPPPPPPVSKRVIPDVPPPAPAPPPPVYDAEPYPFDPSINAPPPPVDAPPMEAPQGLDEPYTDDPPGVDPADMLDMEPPPPPPEFDADGLPMDEPPQDQQFYDQ